MQCRSNAERLVRTELCYVQNQSSLESIKDSGMGFYRVSAAFDKRTCATCAAKDGKEVPVEDASPGDTLPPFHARFRCTIAAALGDGKGRTGKKAARDRDGQAIRIPAGMGYTDWKAVYIDKTRTLQEWEVERKVPKKDLLSQGQGVIIEPRKQRGGDEKIEWPKYDANRALTKEQYIGLRDFANQHGIALSGFRKFDGDVGAIREAIRTLASLREKFPAVADERRRLTLILSDSMDANDFAMTKGRHIVLNANAYRDVNRLAEEYQKLVEEGWFVKGTDWRAIIHHEFGHIVAEFYRISSLDIAEQITKLSIIETLQFVQERLSEYAGNAFDGAEIISEVFSDMSSRVATDFSRTFYVMLIKAVKEGERHGGK